MSITSQISLVSSHFVPTESESYPPSVSNVPPQPPEAGHLSISSCDLLNHPNLCSMTALQALKGDDNGDVPSSSNAAETSGREEWRKSCEPEKKRRIRVTSSWRDDDGLAGVVDTINNTQ